MGPQELTTKLALPDFSDSGTVRLTRYGLCIGERTAAEFNNDAIVLQAPPLSKRRNPPRRVALLPLHAQSTLR